MQTLRSFLIPVPDQGLDRLSRCGAVLPPRAYTWCGNLPPVAPELNGPDEPELRWSHCDWLFSCSLSNELSTNVGKEPNACADGIDKPYATVQCAFASLPFRCRNLRSPNRKLFSRGGKIYDSVV